jgi:probable phosphoglycerate mutase
MTSGDGSAKGQTVYLLRHGDSRQDDIRRLVGQTDYPLNQKGRDQAELWRREFSRIALSNIYCSNLSRSVETARVLSGATDAPLTIVPTFAEIDLGSWDGLPISDIRARFPLEYSERGADLVGYRPPEGESFADLARRVLPAFEEVARDSRGDLLIVGHAGVNRVVLCHLLGMPLANLFRLGQGYGCLSVLESVNGHWALGKLNVEASAGGES